MSAITFRIDPDLPVCWEDQETLRVGFDRAVTRIPHPSVPAQKLLSELISGISSAHLSHTLKRLGASHADWLELKTVLGDAIVTVSDPTGRTARRPRVGVIAPDGAASEPVAKHLISALRRRDILAEEFTEQRHNYQLIVTVERFLQPLSRARLAAAGLPQLGIRFSDQSVRVGPVVSGEGRPCQGCITLQDVDRDPALPILAAQLLDAVPASERHAIDVSAALAASLVQHWVSGSQRFSTTRFTFTVASGVPAPVPEAEHVSAHPDCGCAALSAA